ncbi:MAG: hypothetical protein FH761_09610 [Firmicutes bacterium]|nr:hypothetical protein [Bacillota bacterium]
MNKKIDLFHFSDCGSFDEYNPIRFYNEEYVPELLYLIANGNRYEFNSFDLSKKLSANHDIIKQKLEKTNRLGMTESNRGYYRICFTVFLNKDIEYIKGFSKSVSHSISDIILSNRDKLLDIVKQMKIYGSFDMERILYHLIGDGVFDGVALDYFSDKGLFNISKPQVDNRDYILIGYESSNEIEKFSKKLLCSSNNKVSGKYRFNSFGDGNGNRKDIYRFFRQNQLAIDKSTDNYKLNQIYNEINEGYNQNLLRKIGERLEKISTNEYVFDIYTDFMKEIGYVDITDKETIEIKVPIFKGNDVKLKSKIENIVLEMIDSEVCSYFNGNNEILNNLTPVKHNVSIKEISNELWHLVFGEINEYLIKKGLFAELEDIQGQGRFLQSVYID